VSPRPIEGRATSRVVACALALVLATAVAAADQRTWTFDGDTVGEPPHGFTFARTDGGRMGRWIVRAAADAPSGGRVLAQVDDDRTDGRFALAVAAEPSLRDVRVSVRCRPVGGAVDQACGVVFRYRDENNYYLARANALEDNVNFYHVVSGRRRQVTGWKGRVTGNAWHELRVVAAGDHFEVAWDGQKVIDAHDRTFTEPGKVGLWTKADSITEFDDLMVAEVGAKE